MSAIGADMPAGPQSVGEQGPPITRELLRKLVVGLVILLAVAALCGVLFRESLVEIGGAFIETFGLLGLAVGSMLTDCSPLPLTNEPLMLLALTGGVSAWTILWVVSAASVTAGFVGYGCGTVLGSIPSLRRWLLRKHPDFERFMHRYGAQGVAIAALLPIPFSAATWSAGAMRVPLAKVSLAFLIRIPKTALYLGLIVSGWGVGG